MPFLVPRTAEAAATHGIGQLQNGFGVDGCRAPELAWCEAGGQQAVGTLEVVHLSSLVSHHNVDCR